MMALIFFAPLMYWYITIPEIAYMLYAAFRGGINYGFGDFYLYGLALYYVAFAFNQQGTMAVTAVLILIDFIWHKAHRVPRQDYYYTDTDDHHSYGYDSCPYCGSGDTDGNHCYDCDEDF